MYHGKRVSALVITLSSLLIGLFYYLFFRENTLFLQWFGISGKLHQGTVEDLFGSLPSFLHVFAFSLLTWSLLGPKYRLFSVLLWAVIDTLFESLQLLKSGETCLLPSSLCRYAVNGTFDIKDIAAILIASATSFLIMGHLNRKENR